MRWAVTIFLIPALCVAGVLITPGPITVSSPAVYYIRMVGSTAYAYDANGVTVASNADTGTLVNSLMPAVGRNANGATFRFDRGAFPFATSITHDTPTIKNDLGSVLYLAPVRIIGSGGSDAQDTQEPQKMLGTVFYPTNTFSSGQPIIKINPSAINTRLAFAVEISDLAILCTGNGVSSSQSDTPSYGANPGLSAGISVINPSNGSIYNVWVGSPKGDGIAVTTTEPVVGSGAAFKVDWCWINAEQGSGNYAFNITLDDCEGSNLFTYFTFSGNTDYAGGSGHQQPVRYTNIHSNANNGGTVLETKGSLIVNGLSSHGSGVNPVVFIKRNGSGDVSITNASMIDVRASGAVYYYYVSGTGTVNISGGELTGTINTTELVELAADVPSTEHVNITGASVTGTALSGSFWNTNGHVDYTTANATLDVHTNIAALSGYRKNPSVTSLNVISGGSTTISSGVGSVKMSTANAATNTSWIPIQYAGTTYYVPAWTTNAP